MFEHVELNIIAPAESSNSAYEMFQDLDARWLYFIRVVRPSGVATKTSIVPSTTVRPSARKRHS